MTTSLQEMFKHDAVGEVTDKELSNITKLACDQKDLEKKVKQLESDLDHAKESLRQIQEYLLPEAMAGVGMKEFKLLSGEKITIKDEVFASVRKDFASDAYRWLDSKGLGDVIKNEVSVNFGRGENDTAHDLYEYCKKHGYNVSEKESIHASTLKALVKEQLSMGVQFPEEFFSIMPFKKAVIK